MTFAEYMEQALYGPDGYYSSGKARSGRDGDYFTAPDVGPALGKCLAAIFAGWQKRLSADPFHLIEAGAGEGALAQAVQSALPAQGFRYTAVERSPVRRQKLRSFSLDVRSDVGSFETAPVVGCVFANELIDAFPVHRVRIYTEKLQEAYVPPHPNPLPQGERGPEPLVWDSPSTPLLQAYLDRLELRFPDGYETEINLAMADWIASAARALDRGLVLLIDYGRPAHELFAPERHGGTLRAFHRHRVSSVEAALPAVGADWTADVDFTSLALDAQDAGLMPLAFMEMGSFLIGSVGDSISRWTEKERRGLRYLVHPEGLGAAFHVLILGKNLDPKEWTFEHNRLARLGIGKIPCCK